MPVTVNTLNHDNFRHSVNINNHELFTDLPKSLGGIVGRFLWSIHPDHARRWGG